MNDFTEPVEFDADGKPTRYRWDSDKWFNSLSPREQRNIKRRRKVLDITFKMYRTIPWMRWPVLQYIYAFWEGIFEDGIKSTCKPRWGAVTFGWLNDGIKPTLWHTYIQLTRNHMSKYSGIYPNGAPKSKKQADEWETRWEKELEDKEYLFV
jgi:hypothetical protein